jgi:glutaminyl-tRNA synthetase
VHCIYYPETKSGSDQSGRKVKGTIHWVSAQHALACEVRLYDRLFNVEDPTVEKEGADWKSNLNPDSLQVLNSCLVEPGLKDAPKGSKYQFERQGYFCVDKDSAPGKPVFNRTVQLRDTWAKIEQKSQKGAKK